MSFGPVGIFPPTVALGTTSNAVPVLRYVLSLEGSTSTSTGTTWTTEDVQAAKDWQAAKGITPSGSVHLESWRELLKG